MRIVLEEAGTEYRVASDRKIRTPEDAAAACATVAGMDREAFAVLCLDTKHGLRVAEVVGVGILNSCCVHPREVFRAALRANAYAVVLVHNHPSGDATPSAEDIRITRQLIDAGKIIDIRVLDHVVVGASRSNGIGAWVSMREAGLAQF